MTTPKAKLAGLALIAALCGGALLIGLVARAAEETRLRTDTQESITKSRAPLKTGANAFSTGDYATAFREWLSLAEKGNAEAHGLLGLLYQRGAADNQRSAENFMLLVSLRDTGRETGPKDLTEVVEWFRSSAAKGLGSAQVHLGTMYAEATGFSKDYAEAAKWYRKAAEQGYLEGQKQLAILYSWGSGVPQDDVQAYKWLSLAAAQKDHDAAARLFGIGRRMTTAQKAEAQKLAREWKPKK